VPETSNDHRWLALALLCAVQFMVVLDIAIVNVALPSIGRSLRFSEENLQWVVSAYTLTFGGFLLLGGRAADLLGRRRVFMAGLALFSLASLVCGLASSEGTLIAFRAVQGLGAAIVSPAALSILTTTFEEGQERNRALGIWGAIAGTGGAAGVLLGGILTDTLSWSWIFFINVPIGAAVLALSPRLLRESRVETAERHFDLAGAVSVTTGLVLLVYGLVESNSLGWGSPRVVGALIVAAVLLVAFVAIESRSAQPLVPLHMFRRRSLTGANIVGFLLGSAVFAMFFFLSLYMQQVLGYSPLRTGLAYLLISATIIASAGAAQALVTRFGVRSVLAAGMGLSAIGLLLFTRVSVGGSYLDDLVPGFVFSGIGLGFGFVPVTIAAVAGVRNDEAGAASGLINTSQQIGGALGVALLSTIATSRIDDYAASHGGQVSPAALVDGFGAAFAVGAVLAAVGLVVTLLLIPRGVSQPPARELEPALDTR
jgi:EmrB/QacA subfamily drug resistance transporter